MVGIAQLVSASDCGSEGRGFETHHSPQSDLHFCKSLFLLYTIMKFIENKTYTGIIAAETPLEKAEYVDCVFENCDFSNAFLNNYEFEECQFINCNFSLCNVANTSFRTVQFEGCKMMGVNFTKIKDFLCSMHFTNCNLNFALFTDLPVKGLIFEHCNLQQADFSQADITGSSFVETLCVLIKLLYLCTRK